MHVEARRKLDFVFSNDELHGINVKVRKCLLGETHVKSVKATALLPRNYNAK